MKSYKILISLIASAVICSCAPIENYYVPGYISEYYFLQEDNSIIVNNDDVENGTLSIKLPAHISRSVDVTNYGKKHKKKEYYRLCQKFDDMYYNQHVREPAVGDTWHNYVRAIADVVSDVAIVSDDDWSAAYPKGALLNDLFSVKCKTIYPYIKSRYTAESVFTAIDKPLSDIVESDLTLLQQVSYGYYNESPHYWVQTGSCFLELYTDKLPDSPIQSLHITLTTDESKTLEYSVELDLR